MSRDLLIVLGLLAAVIVLFVRGRPRMDVVALLAIVVLPMAGVIRVEDALAGLSNPSVVLIAAMFVVGDGLVRTGIARRLGDWIARRAGQSEAKLVALLMVMVAGLGSMMSSTGVVAIFIPIALRIAARTRTPPGRLLMPLAFAGLISGMLSLISTPPNLIVHSELLRRGEAGFGFFSITPFGLPILVMGIAYMMVARRWLTPRDADTSVATTGRPNLTDLARRFSLETRLHRTRVDMNSRLIGHTLGELRLRSNERVDVVAIEKPWRSGTTVLSPTATTRIEAGDILLVGAPASTTTAAELRSRIGLMAMPYAPDYFTDHADEVGLAEVLLPPESALIGQSVAGAQFRSKFNLTVVGLRRNLAAIDHGLVDEKLEAGDVLLLIGPWKAIRALRGDARDFVPLNLPAEMDDWAPAGDRVPHALASVALMVVLMITGVVPNVIAAFIGCLALGATRCITAESSYRAIHWQSLILIAGMMPFAIALERTGGVELAARSLTHFAGGAGPYAMLACLFVATTVIGLFISNTTTAVLMAPVAISAAEHLGLPPHPFAMVVALAASTAFMTPISSPVNTLVVEPGRYRFSDFVKIGTPFSILVMIASLLLIAWRYPLAP